MRSAQHQVELRSLGNQLPLLGKANSLCKLNCKMLCVCLFFNLSGPHRARNKDRAGNKDTVARAKSM